MNKNSLKKIIRDCINEVLEEGFDPTSMGPNPIEDNPYPAWNAKMKTLEEEEDDIEQDEDISSNPHGRYAQEAGADGFDSRYFGVQ